MVGTSTGWHTPSQPRRVKARLGEVLRGALQGDNRKVLAPFAVAGLEFESNAGLSEDEGVRSGAWGSTGPTRSGLEARSAARWAPVVVELVGRASTESVVRALPVVPTAPEREFGLHLGLQERIKGEPPYASVFKVRIRRSTTATLPYLPIAPNRCRIPRRPHQRLKVLATNCLPLSVMRW